jgi:dolichol-phosphate mannosyltransferase
MMPPFPSLEFGLIIPVLNERDNVVPLLDRIAKALPQTIYEVLFVDDGSTDGTLDLVRSIALTNPRVRLVQRIGRKGLSTAVIEGMLATAAPILGVIDGDMQHDEAILPQLIDIIREGEADIAIGSRYIKGGGTEGWDEARLKGSKFATWLGNLVIGTASTDPMSGFFVTRRDLIVELQPRLSGIGFKILIDLMASSKTPLRIKEVPYIFRGRVAGESKMGSAVVIEYLMLLIDKSIGRILPARLVMFLGVGGLGVGVHLAILGTGLRSGLAFAVAQSFAVGGAILFNYTLNNLFTYRDRQRKGWAFVTGLGSFALVSLAGAIANVGVGSYAFAAHTTWWIAGIAGAAMSAVWNYAATSLVTWKE